MHLHPRKPEPGVVVNPSVSSLRVTNAILWGKAKQHYVADFPGPLSIKSVIRGTASWGTSEAERLVDGTNYLILNSGRPYSLTIDSRETVETFCLFFRPGIVEDACHVESSNPAALLDNLSRNGERLASSPPVEFLETLYPTVSPLLQRMYARLTQGSASQAWLADQFLEVAAALLRVRDKGHKRAARIPAKKSSTRLELYRRLLRGKDYLDSFSGTQVRLAEVANEACLSPYHFHRLFREVFRETPNQYVQRKRLANAQRLLERGEQSVTDVCLEVGFESITSFSGLFRRSFGCSPREYRLRKSRPR
jgi:AraC family transcriptional regulator